ncbi:MAG: hypothetical protein U5O39_01995 [Gammaproteobacteria bacterium]|nr:hypothetical protein [Gammaproteobacteria bacterium]
MPWGGEDREFGVRLLNKGIRARHVRYDAVVIHLDHDRSYVDPLKVAQNKQLRQTSEKTGRCWTDYGIEHADGNAGDQPRVNRVACARANPATSANGGPGGDGKSRAT